MNWVDREEKERRGEEKSAASRHGAMGKWAQLVRTEQVQGVDTVLGVQGRHVVVPVVQVATKAVLCVDK